jgi:zinc/manganese transport system permease protein
MHPSLVLLAPGFFANGPVRTALAVGGWAALVAAVVGVFTVVRGQTFAGHALADVSSAGGSASFLLGVSPLLGFLGMATIAAAAMEWADIRDARERDVVTGIVLGAGLGLAALMLYLDSTLGSTSGAAITILFGSMFAVGPAIVPLALGVGAAAIAIVGTIYRPLLVSSLSADLAAAQGTRVRTVGLLHALALALAVSLSAITVGAMLSTALLIGPAATGLRLADRPARALALAVLTGLAATWLGILLAYDSYYWTPGHGWPVSFFIVSLLVVFYLLANVASRRARTRCGSAHQTRLADGS